MPNTTTTTTAATATKRGLLYNPFGVMIGTQTAPGLLGARQLKPNWMRLNSNFSISTWAQSDNLSQIQNARDAGWKICAIVTNTDSPSTPVVSASSINTYRANLASMLNFVRPDLLVVGNEYTVNSFFTGTASNYTTEATIAIEAAKARNIKVCNDGMVSDLCSYLVWADYLDAGDRSKACSYAQRAFAPATASVLCGYATLSAALAAVRTAVAEGRQFLDVYKSLPFDYVNLHLYFKNEMALDETVNYFERATGKRAITTEIGQQDTIDPNDIEMKMNWVLKRQMPIAIFYTPLTVSGDAVNFVNTDGTLKANGNRYVEVRNRYFP